MDAIFSQISIVAILQLHWLVKVPSFLLVFWLAWRTIVAISNFRIARVFINVATIYLLAFSLSRFGFHMQNALLVYIPVA